MHFEKKTRKFSVLQYRVKSDKEYGKKTFVPTLIM